MTPFEAILINYYTMTVRCRLGMHEERFCSCFINNPFTTDPCDSNLVSSVIPFYKYKFTCLYFAALPIAMGLIQTLHTNRYYTYIGINQQHVMMLYNVLNITQ